SVADDADMQAAACCASQAGLAHARHFALSPSALLQKDAEFSGPSDRCVSCLLLLQRSRGKQARKAIAPIASAPQIRPIRDFGSTLPLPPPMVVLSFEHQSVTAIRNHG